MSKTASGISMMANSATIEATDPAHSPINSQSLSNKAGARSSMPARHFDKSKPMIEQLPTEILDMVLSEVDAIWIFQLEKASSKLRGYLQSSESNRMWSEKSTEFVMFDAMYEHDDHHPDQEDEGVSSPDPGNNHETDYAPEPNDTAQLGPEEEIRPIYSAETPMILPFLNEAERHNDYEVLKTAYYESNYIPALNYRHEILKSLHCVDRCCICFKSLDWEYTSFLRYRYLGITWCQTCLDEWAVEPGKVEFVPGLNQLVEKEKENALTVWAPDYYHDRLYWGPLLDSILTRERAVDFKTAYLIAQCYWKPETDGHFLFLN